MEFDKVKEIFGFIKEFGLSMFWRRYVKYRLKRYDKDRRDIAIGLEVRKYLFKHFGYVLHTDFQYPEPPKTFDDMNLPVWIFWWQGEKQMPALVKTCYNSIKSNTPNCHPVILLTQDNYEEFIQLPAWIIDKFKAKEFTITHFSDILRSYLLFNYGGLWLDSTMFVTQQIPESLFHNDFVTLIPYFRGRKFMNLDWCVFAMGGKKYNKIHYLLYSFFLEYWQHHKKIINYLLIDNVIGLCYEKLDDVKRKILDGGFDTPNLFEMQQILGSPFDEGKFKDLCENNIFHKLTYKRGNVINDNVKTLFQYLTELKIK
jgi:hypothetical protein